MYHDGKNVSFSANTFHCDSPRLTCSFIKHNDIINRTLAVRSMELEIYVHNADSERKWNNALSALVESSKNLRHVRIRVEEDIWSGLYHSSLRCRHSPAYGRRPFLKGLLELKKLPLQTVKLDVTGKSWRGMHRRREFTWTHAQKEEWAQSVKRAILGSG